MRFDLSTSTSKNRSCVLMMRSPDPSVQREMHTTILQNFIMVPYMCGIFSIDSCWDLYDIEMRHSWFSESSVFQATFVLHTVCVAQQYSVKKNCAVRYTHQSTYKLTILQSHSDKHTYIQSHSDKHTYTQSPSDQHMHIHAVTQRPTHMHAMIATTNIQVSECGELMSQSGLSLNLVDSYKFAD